MRIRHLLLGLAACVTLALVGCAAPDGQSGTGTSSDAPASPTPAASVPLLPTESAKPGAKPSAGQKITVTGTVMDGVEAKCLILRTDTASYQLLGGDPAVVHADARITVTGFVRTDVMSYCMQGIPLEVTSAVPA